MPQRLDVTGVDGIDGRRGKWMLTLRGLLRCRGECRFSVQFGRVEQRVSARPIVHHEHHSVVAEVECDRRAWGIGLLDSALVASQDEVVGQVLEHERGQRSAGRAGQQVYERHHLGAPAAGLLATGPPDELHVVGEQAVNMAYAGVPRLAENGCGDHPTSMRWPRPKHKLRTVIPTGPNKLQVGLEGLRMCSASEDQPVGRRREKIRRGRR